MNANLLERKLTLEAEIEDAKNKLAAAQKRAERAEANLEAYLATAGEQEDLSALEAEIDEAMDDLTDATIRAERAQEDFVCALYQTDKCPECGAGKAHLQLVSDFLLCDKCNKATAAAELELLDAQRQ